mgnify:CR=1 FL=1
MYRLVLEKWLPSWAPPVAAKLLYSTFSQELMSRIQEMSRSKINPYLESLTMPELE